MKKISVVFLFAFLAIFVSNAQGPLSKGQKQINAGLGFDSWGLPIYVGFDYGIHPDVSIGGEFTFASENHVSMIGIIGNGNYHFNHLLEISRNWDVYAGLNLGIYISSWDNQINDNRDSHSDVDLGLQFGGRYYFNSNWGLNLEVRANSFPDGKIGISYRF